MAASPAHRRGPRDRFGGPLGVNPPSSGAHQCALDPIDIPMIRSLVPPVLRTTPWHGFIPAGIVAAVLAIVASRQPTDVEHRYLPTRMALLAVAIAVGFVFDDPASPLTDPAPSPLRLRRLLRTVMALAIAAAIFTIVLLVAAQDMALAAVVDSTPEAATVDTVLNPNAELSTFPWGRLAIETATMIGFVLAAAAVVNRRGEPEPGKTATAFLLAAFAVSWILPEPLQPWSDPTDQRWQASITWWWIALAVVWLTTTVLSWDTRIGRPLTPRRSPSAPSPMAPESTRDAHG